jgi:hypothetical protein
MEIISYIMYKYKIIISQDIITFFYYQHLGLLYILQCLILSKQEHKFPLGFVLSELLVRHNYFNHNIFFFLFSTSLLKKQPTCF